MTTRDIALSIYTATPWSQRWHNRVWLFSNRLVVLKAMTPVLWSNSSEINIGQVEDIQELWRSRPTTVPERYVHDVEERLVSPHYPSIELKVPVIGMSKLIWDNLCEARNEMAQLTAACQEWGFFQVSSCSLTERHSFRQVTVNLSFVPGFQKKC